MANELAVPQKSELPEPKIKFSRYWVAVGQSEVLNAVTALSERDLLPTEAKLLLLALGSANNGGHAEFIAGELQQLLGRVDKDTGELKPMTRRGVEIAKKRLADAGLLVDTSGGMRCVWLNAAIFQRNRQHGGWKCAAHRIADRGYR